jgi:hypothetical protein
MIASFFAFHSVYELGAVFYFLSPPFFKAIRRPKQKSVSCQPSALS